MIVSMPTGSTHGWGIAGTYLSREIAKLPRIDGVTLHSVAGHHFAPSCPEQWNRINIGYCFFESEILAYHYIPQAARKWDYIVAGSSWCEHHLRIAGMQRTSTILQGVDPSQFFPLPCRKDDSRFIVFSGGKFEYRKGHDLVIAAMRVFMAHHPDVWLACAWHNHWPASIMTMQQSRLMEFSYQDLPCDQLYLSLLEKNGIPLDRVLLYPVLDNRQMRHVYQNSDIGLFPNRCEGGNNMVMCEYMACARPVIASTMTGHQDVICPENAFCLTNYEPVLAVQDGAPAGVWFEASVEEIICLLDQAYQDRPSLVRLAEAAGRSMKPLSWQNTADRFHAIALKLAGHGDIAPQTGSTFAVHKQAAAEQFASDNFPAAEQIYRQMLLQQPLNPELHNNLATTLDRLERFAEAQLHYEKALALDKSYVEARFNLANTLQRLGNTKEAIRQLEIVVTENPRFLPAWQNLALCRLTYNDSDGAITALEQVLEIAPECSRSLEDLGNLLLEQRRWIEALGYIEKALQTTPDNQGLLNSKGVALQRIDNLEMAEDCFQKILTQDPDNTLALNNIGALRRAQGKPEEALIFFNRALALVPDDGKIIFNRALAELITGDYDSGWEDYEARFTTGGSVKELHTDIQRWKGEPVVGRQILLWSEQGYGDAIQFVRYAMALSDIGATVVVEAQDEKIAPLLAVAEGVSQVVVRNSHHLIPDFQIPMMSLPRFFGNISCPPSYFKPLSTSSMFSEIIKSANGRLKVGLAWAGRPAHEDDRNRSIAANLLKPLASFADIDFVNLQFSSAGYPLGLNLLDMRAKIRNFLDSAALVTQLDLVITVDTAVAHLAGALGVPVWIMLPFNPDWRWLLNQEKTIWYASARLFRQQRPYQWEEVIGEVLEELKKI